MAKTANSISDLIGNTPLLQPLHFLQTEKIENNFFVKLEYLNPAGSVKDRVAIALVQNLEEKGLLQKGSVLVEPTSGNTGIALAAIAASRGYRVILTMPETMSVERRALLAAYGAEIILTSGAKGMGGAMERAQEIVKDTPGSVMPAQFQNPANPTAHMQSTGPEIWRDTGGKIDIFVCGVGTGGTISGGGNYLKAQNPHIQVVAVEPSGSPLLSAGQTGSHRIQGIGAGFVPDTLDTTVYDEVVPVADEDAFHRMRDFACAEGLLIGISSGAALHAGVLIAKKAENAGKTVVVLLPDGGERYLSMGIFRKIG